MHGFACRMVFGIVAAISFALSPDLAAGAEQLKAVAEFLRSNVINRRIAQETVQRIADGKVETVFSRAVVFTDLTEGDNGLQFRGIATIRQSNYDLDAAGARVGGPINEDRTIVMRFDLSERQSTGELLGLSYVESSTSKLCRPGTGSLVRMNLKDGKLLMTETTIGYADAFGPGGKPQPGGQEETWTFTVVDGKLVAEEDIQFFDVDPSTLTRKTSGSRIRSTNRQP